MSEALQMTRDGGVVTLTMNEPKSRNALSDALREGLSSAVRALSQDTEVRAVILTGSGGVFCAGGDLKKMLANHKAGLVTGSEDILPRMKHLHGWIKLLRDLPVPVITAVDGPAYGAGLGLALTGDIILASDRASFNASFCKVGAVPDGNLFYSLPRMVGLQRAREMFYTGRTVEAAEAKDIGICLEVTTPENLLPRAQEMARMGLALWKVQFVGRWGSDAVTRYVESAYHEMAAGFSTEMAKARDPTTEVKSITKVSLTTRNG